MEKTAKQIVSEYKMKCALVIALYIVALAVLIWLMGTSIFVSIAGIVALVMSIRMTYDKLLEKNIESVIQDKLDPETYNEILALGIAKKSMHLQVLGAMSAGNHERVIELVGEREKKSIHPVERCNDLYRKGFVYFEQGDLEKLRAVVREYEKLKKDNPKFTAIFENFTVFDKYDAFLDEDYEYVVDVCDIDLKELNTGKKENHKVTRINVSFYRAVSLYKMGKIDEARKGFDDIIVFAPKMNKAKLSREYLEMMK